jgi:hypothetical protein
MIIGIAHINIVNYVFEIMPILDMLKCKYKFNGFDGATDEFVSDMDDTSLALVMIHFNKEDILMQCKCEE